MRGRTPILVLLLLLAPLQSFAQEKSDRGVPDYSTTPRAEIPVELTWRIEDLFAGREEWEKERQRVLQEVERLEKLAPEWTTTPQKMLEFMRLADDLRISGFRLGAYARLQSDTDMANPWYKMMLGGLMAIFVQVQSKFSFINDDILALGGEKFEQYLAGEPGLAPYAFGIRSLLRGKEHVLRSEQQRIVALTGLFTNVPSDASEMLNNVEIPRPEITLAGGERVVLNDANYRRYRASKNPEERSAVSKGFWENQKQFESTFAILLNGAMKQHLFSAQVHNFEDCLAARLFNDDIDPQVYHTLIKAVRENLEPLHRYLRLRQRLLGLEKLRYSDAYASAVEAVDKVYTYSEAREIVLEAMKPLGDEYLAALRRAFDERWIDIYPNKGKQSGAYSSGVYGAHPYVKLNYNGSYDSVSTLAHELGHAMHSYFSSESQPYATSGYPTFLAEIASTFNENLLMDHLLAAEEDDLFKLYVLDQYLNRFRSTVFRQTLFAEFELAMHGQVEEGKTLTPQWLNSEYLRLTRDYYGHDAGITEVGDYIRSEWSWIPHFYLNYYVYTYATGMIASTALSEMVGSGGAEERERYLALLKSGGSDFPLDILRKAGVDMTTVEPFEAALHRFDNLVAEMERIVDRLGSKAE